MTEELSFRFRQKRILVVGNGFVRITQGREAYVNRHTAVFLTDLATRGYRIAFAQPFWRTESSGGLNDGFLPPEAIKLVELDKKHPGRLLSCMIEVLRADFVYLFFPGSWARLFGRLCLALGKPFGIYLRGEQFSDSGADARLIQNAQRVCTVAGLEQRVESLGGTAMPIAPMLDMNLSDALSKEIPLDTPTRPLRILFVGRLEQAKGIPELVDAAERLWADGLDFEMRLVGGGPLYDDLASHISASGGLPIQLVGLIADKKHLMDEYAWTDILVLPTHHEGFPRVLYEAMLTSCVILTTFVGGISSLMKDAGNCVELPLRDAEGLAQAIRKIAGDRRLMRRLSQAGKATVINVLETRPKHLTAVLEMIDAKS